jgi:hypothetical protein
MGETNRGATMIRELSLACVMSVACLASAQAAVISETFDTGNGGFTNGDVASSTTPSAVVDRTAATFNPTGGNPGGYISVSDNYNANAFFAPSSFVTGVQSGYGGTFSFDLGDRDGIDQGTSTLIIYGNGTSVAANTALPTTNFTHFNVTLTEGNFSFYSGDFNPNSGAAPTTAQFAAILAGATSVAFFADYHNGSDTAILDNVVLTTPNPTTTVPGPIAGAGLIPLGFAGAWWARRRKKLSVS